MEALFLGFFRVKLGCEQVSTLDGTAKCFSVILRQSPCIGWIDWVDEVTVNKVKLVLFSVNPVK